MERLHSSIREWDSNSFPGDVVKELEGIQGRLFVLGDPAAARQALEEMRDRWEAYWK